MPPAAPKQLNRSSPGGLSLWLGAILALALLLATSQAQAVALAHPDDPAVTAGLGPVAEAAPLDVRHASTDLPHCHHPTAWRPSFGLPSRSESPDSAAEPASPTTQNVGRPVHLTSPLGRAGPHALPSLPLYLLTQRFRS